MIPALLFFVLTILSTQMLSYADTIHLSGTVLNVSDKGITGAEVSLYKRNGLKTLTDANGNFELTGNLSVRSAYHINKSTHEINIKANVLEIKTLFFSNTVVFIYDIKGKKIKTIFAESSAEEIKKIKIPKLSSGTYLFSIVSNGKNTVMKVTFTGNTWCKGRIYFVNECNNKLLSSKNAEDEFNDILMVTYKETQTVRRAVTSCEESGIKIRLMPIGVSNSTPTIPLFTDKGGVGDVTTYGSVTEHEYSTGGACNYGSTKIPYYAAINVNQIPGDLKGNWDSGSVCGRCAKVSVRTIGGDLRTTVVRIVDKCPDDNCGIDLGGAPAYQIMKMEPGRYSGEWEWISCEGVEGVYDGPASINVKAGSNEWWSLIQVRNGPGSVSQISVRKVGEMQWQNLIWATEAENYYKVPVGLLQDSNYWDFEVKFDLSTTAALLRIQGNKLAVENSSYELQF